MLRKLDENLHVADVPFKMLGLELGGRMTVIGLEDGGVALISPVKPQDALFEAIDQLGPVKAIIGPNRFHHLFLRPYQERYPDAQLLATEGLAKKRKDLKFDNLFCSYPEEVLGNTVHHILCGGIPKLDEVFIYHKPSKSLVVTDFIFNVKKAKPYTKWFLKIVEGAYGKPEVPRLIKLFAADRQEVKKSIQQVLELDIQRVIPCHGLVIDSEEDLAQFHKAMKTAFR